jgi:pentatricopeptide repeat protein
MSSAAARGAVHASCVMHGGGRCRRRVRAVAFAANGRSSDGLSSSKIGASSNRGGAASSPVVSARALPTEFPATRVGSAEGSDAAAAAAAATAGEYRILQSRELNQALQFLGKGSNWRAVFDIFDSLCEEGVGKGGKGVGKGGGNANALRPPRAPNSHVATTVLSIAGRRGDLDRVRGTFQWMRAQGPGRSAPTAHTYTAYIQAVGGAGLWREAFELYNDMRIEGVRPTSHTYSAGLALFTYRTVVYRTVVTERLLQNGCYRTVVRYFAVK